MKLKRTLALLLCLVLLSVFITPFSADAGYYGGSMTNFDPYAKGYSYGQFSDVDENAWYGMNSQGVVVTACRLGLMNGTGNGFAPDGSLTIAQVVTMAVRLHATYHAYGDEFVQGSPWYQCYVDYAEEAGILYEGEFSGEMNRAATRAEMAYLLYYALPDEELEAINSVTPLPDVRSDNPYYEQILYMYNAGILTGNDAYGTFAPSSPITRAAAAAIVSRMALPELRKQFTLSVTSTAPATPPAAYSLDYSHYTSVEKPASIDTYSDLVRAWEWMLVNSVFQAQFSSGISCSESEMDTLQDAALEAFTLVATLDYFDYASFRRAVRIGVSYNTLNGHCTNLKLTMTLRNVDGLSESTIKSQVASFETKCADIVTSLYNSGELKATMTNKEKAYVLFRYVVLNNAYDESLKYYTGYDAAVRGSSVCQGYAGLYSYLCNLAGVPMRAITGTADGGSHAWNRIYENGQWFYIDTTYADPTPDKAGYCDDDWFWLTERQLQNANRRTFDTDNIVYAGAFSQKLADLAA